MSADASEESVSIADSFLPGSTGERARRIPPYIEPLEYYVRVKPYFPNDVAPATKENNMTFDGLSTFIFRAKEPRMNITLHSLLLNYTKVTFMDAEGSVINESPRYTFNEELNHIIIHLNKPLETNTVYMLQFVYTGGIHDYQATGLYYSSFTDVEGIQQ
ncbi:unnamed protein product [Toxocara canis]|uniref:Peptidase_M1_N domain-containing protein n=1 Tax=Toxocara canis TaxID=6265 RepID=A0A183UKZ4_TOXCA|nr:unnamed protein product [Toxocara canis]